MLLANTRQTTPSACLFTDPNLFVTSRMTSNYVAINGASHNADSHL